MSITEIKWSACIDEPWLRMEPYRIGDVPSGLGTPDQYILVNKDDCSMSRVDAYKSSNECFCFQDARIWREFLAVGWGDHLYLICADSGTIVKHDLGSYFGSMTTHDESLLVASAHRLHRIGSDGTILWQTDYIAIDGVVIDEFEESYVKVSCELDPPDGWEPVSINLDSGEVVQSD